MPKIAEEGDEMNVFGVKYKVKGPQKDYTSDTAYQRIAMENASAIL